MLVYSMVRYWLELTVSFEVNVESERQCVTCHVAQSCLLRRPGAKSVLNSVCIDTDSCHATR